MSRVAVSAAGRWIAIGVAVLALVLAMRALMPAKPPGIAAPRRTVQAPPPRAATPALAEFAAALPAGAALHAVEVAGGVVRSAEVDTPDPEALRSALAARTALAGLRTTGEASVPDRGVRVRLERAGQVPDGGMPPEAGRASALARRLLVEPDLAVSGQPAAVLGWMAEVEAGGWRFVRLALSQLPGDGAVRLSGRVARAPPGRAVPPPSLPLGPPEPAGPADDAPALAGIVGRWPGEAVALVRGDGGRPLTVARGGVVEGWTLAALSPDAALFVRGGERRRVPLPTAEPAPDDEGESR